MRYLEAGHQLHGGRQVVRGVCAGEPDQGRGPLVVVSDPSQPGLPTLGVAVGDGEDGVAQYPVGDRSGTGAVLACPLDLPHGELGVDDGLDVFHVRLEPLGRPGAALFGDGGEGLLRVVQKSLGPDWGPGGPASGQFPQRFGTGGGGFPRGVLRLRQEAQGRVRIEAGGCIGSRSEDFTLHARALLALGHQSHRLLQQRPGQVRRRRR
ncbi:hypothetical protein ACFQ7B_31425 [Streptomyces erythrochromogenes]|uniref:hypothetical protein n=1 Tax=Streptomyces erythrochromogenes TaxID=285574 RepID=UPI0036BEF389